MVMPVSVVCARRSQWCVEVLEAYIRRVAS